MRHSHWFNRTLHEPDRGAIADTNQTSGQGADAFLSGSITCGAPGTSYTNQNSGPRTDTKHRYSTLLAVAQGEKLCRQVYRRQSVCRYRYTKAVLGPTFVGKS